MRIAPAKRKGFVLAASRSRVQISDRDGGRSRQGSSLHDHRPIGAAYLQSLLRNNDNIARPQNGVEGIAGEDGIVARRNHAAVGAKHEGRFFVGERSQTAGLRQIPMGTFARAETDGSGMKDLAVHHDVSGGSWNNQRISVLHDDIDGSVFPLLNSTVKVDDDTADRWIHL